MAALSSLLFYSACTFQEPQAPTWSVWLSVPLINKTYTMEDLAEQAVDELLDIEGLDKERAGVLIMTARAPWFAEEAAD